MHHQEKKKKYESKTFGPLVPPNGISKKNTETKEKSKTNTKKHQ